MKTISPSLLLPNPFNSSTTIQYDLPEDGFDNISIDNILDDHIITLENSYEQAGYKVVYWNEYDQNNHLAPSGVYMYQIEYKDNTSIRKRCL
ncbi:hypothetical protein [Fidelibacter multiformis]|uniref:hypothetical protein n=1 Tax=Fidelibacter multiformis TaxID=3377529 RepID=UPI0037DD3E6B